MTMRFDRPRARKGTDLTPMIDVVFLLLVFFMLASRFVTDTTIPVATAGAQGQTDQTALRLVDVETGGAVRLNGGPVALAGLADAITALGAGLDDAIVLRGRETTVQDIIGVMETLREAGFTRLVLAE
ncbi:MAG: biopolymer transporter ExbD [Proteobacteria bacterium]|nr:biopolymer transporter ExbD [Pseudomonadota bacterium]